MKNEITELKKIQNIEAEMLDEFKRICEKNNLKYFLDGGTLLGAVRHKGFIPWDDDIDVVMLRKDYDRLSEIVDRELSKEYIYQDWKREPDYPYNFAKIRKKGTLFLQKELSHLNMNHGIFIDIFPIDHVPDDIVERSSYMRRIRRRKLIQSILYMGKYKGDEKRPFYQRVIISVVGILFNRGRCHKKLDGLLLKYENRHTDYVCSLLGNCEEKEVVDKDFFQKSMELEFEQEQYACPERYHEWLTKIYGDYMQIPPENERVTHHGTTTIEFGV